MSGARKSQRQTRTITIAQRVLNRGRKSQNVARLQKALAIVAFALLVVNRVDVDVYRLLGWMAGLRDRGALLVPALNLRGRLIVRAFAFYFRYVEWKLERRDSLAPQWMDYWLARWLITGQRESAMELFIRAVGILPSYDEGFPLLRRARFVVSTARFAYPDFDQEMRAFEDHYSVALSSVLPEEMA